MKLKKQSRFFFFIIFILAINVFSVFAAQTKDNEELADVAILSFVNKTGSKNYEWIKNSLPDAINSAMASQFVFQRVAFEKYQDLVQSKTELNESFLFEDVNILAQKTNSDIIVYGEFNYDQENNLLVIDSHIFMSIVGSEIKTITTTASINSSLFKAIKNVSGDIVKYINNVVQTEIARQKIELKSKGEELPAATEIESKNKQKKIRLVKDKRVQLKFAKMNLAPEIAPVLGVGRYSNFTPFGGLFRLLYTSDFSSWFFWGARLGGVMMDPARSPNSYVLVGYYALPVEALIGLNFLTFRRVLWQPYLAVGAQVQFLFYEENDWYAYENAPEEYERTYLSGLLTLGLRVPVRLTSKDFSQFIVPFAEVSWLPRFTQGETTYFTFHLGVAYSFGLGKSRILK